MSGLRDKIVDAKAPVIFYEVIPPTRETDQDVAKAYAECTVEMINSTSISVDAINLPEIRAERRSAERTHAYEPKTDQRQFACELRSQFNNKVDLVVNHCTVYENWEEQQEWLKETEQAFQIDNLVLVGGETSKVKYPGPSVTEMAQSVNYAYGDTFFCGGVTIPTRRHSDPRKDEPHRLFQKGQHGLEFFTSQVLYETDSIQGLLKNYDQLCRENNESPKRIFLSFAPVSSKKDITFLRWLGVEMPKDVEKQLMKANIGVGWRSLQESKKLLETILNFVSDENIQVPLALNVEHITRHNFELSKEFIEQLGNIYYEHMGIGASTK